MRAAVRASGIVKRYGEATALNGLNFEAARGELFGLIGPDGAGKTSLLRILATLLLPDQGSAEVLGMDVVKHYRDIRKVLGYMPGRFSLYQDLSVRENLEFFATVFGTSVEENYALVSDIYRQIEPFRDRLAGKLSGGMKQKLALSCALIHKPEILLLDEPTTGVDAVSRREFWDMLQRLRNDGLTILVSTPYMDEANRCDRVALIQSGRILRTDTPSAIASSYPWCLYSLKSADMYGLQQALATLPGMISVYRFGQYLHLSLREDSADTLRIAGFLQERGIPDAEIRPVEPGIEDCFMDMMTTSADA